MEIAFFNLMAIISGVAAIAVTVIRPGNNPQAVRAVAVIGILTMEFGLAMAAFGWAMLEVVFPDAELTIKDIRKKKKSAAA